MSGQGMRHRGGQRGQLPHERRGRRSPPPPARARLNSQTRITAAWAARRDRTVPMTASDGGWCVVHRRDCPLGTADGRGTPKYQRRGSTDGGVPVRAQHHDQRVEGSGGDALVPCRACPAARPRTLVDKIWDDHVVADEPGAPTVLGIDLHLVHEVTSPQAFTGLRQRGLPVRRPGQTVATADHSIPTHDRSLPIVDCHGGGPGPAARPTTAASSGSRSTGSGRRTRGSSTSSDPSSA